MGSGVAKRVYTAPRRVFRTDNCPQCGGFLLPYALEGDEGRVPESVYRCVLCSRLYLEAIEGDQRVWLSWVRIVSST